MEEAGNNKSWTTASRGWSVGMVGVLALAGALLQLAAPATPASAIITCTAISVLLVVLGAVSRRLRLIIAGFRHAASASIVVAAVAMLGTLIPQGQPSDLYRGRYGGLAGLILALRLDDVFHGLIFAAVVGVVVGSLAVAMIARWPVRRRNLGFFLCHAGLVLALAGGGISSLWAVRGRLDLRVGAPAQNVIVAGSRGAAARELPLGFSIGLDTFEVEEGRLFRSTVRLVDTAAERRAAISVNHPLRAGRWTLYQVNYDPEDLAYSGLEAVDDPGVPVVFVGFAMIVVGVFVMIYLYPRRPVREEKLS